MSDCKSACTQVPFLCNSFGHSGCASDNMVYFKVLYNSLLSINGVESEGIVRVPPDGVLSVGGRSTKTAAACSMCCDACNYMMLCQCQRGGVLNHFVVGGTAQSGHTDCRISLLLPPARRWCCAADVPVIISKRPCPRPTPWYAMALGAVGSCMGAPHVQAAHGVENGTLKLEMSSNAKRGIGYGFATRATGPLWRASAIMVPLYIVSPSTVMSFRCRGPDTGKSLQECHIPSVFCVRFQMAGNNCSE